MRDLTHPIKTRFEWPNVRYWKGTYDENIERDLELCSRVGMRPDQDEAREMWVFRVLVAIQVVMVTLAGLLFVAER